MFELINNIRSELAGVPLHSPPVDVKDRCEIITDVVQRLYNNAVPGNQKNISVCLKKTFEFGRFEASSLKLFVPALFYITSEEIPKRFQFTGVELRLNSETFLKKYSDWLCARLNIEDLNPNLSKNLIQLNLAVTQNEQKAQAAIKFILMHELGHIHYSDAHYKRGWYWISASLSISCPIVAALLIKGPLLPSIFGIAAAAIISFLALKIIFDVSFGRFTENRADAFACKHCPDSIEGGIHFLQIKMQRIQRIRQEILKKIDKQEAEHSNTSTLSAITIKCASAIRKCRLKARISAEGDLLSFGHPPHSTRIKKLRRFQEQSNLAPSL